VDTVKSAPEKPGAYVIRMSGGKLFPRLKGETDIVYIGSSKNLRRRFYWFLKPGPTQWTSQRINQFSKKYRLEIAWLENDNPKNIEHNLLRDFLSQHDELPPLNRAYIRNLK
jgi:excinuclease UvrABC nuclease subunit